MAKPKPKRKGVMARSAAKHKAAPVAGKEKPAPRESRERTQEQEQVESMKFFPGQTVKIELRNWSPLNSMGKEFRLHLDMSIPLSLVHAMPHQIDAAFQSVAQLDNGIHTCKVEAVVDPQTIRVFATPESSRAAATWPASMLNNLAVTRPKSQSKKDPTDVELRFSTAVKVTDEQLVWAKNHHRKFFFAQFEVTQGSLVDQANKARGVLPINGKAEEEPLLPLAVGAESDGKAAAAGPDA